MKYVEIRLIVPLVEKGAGAMATCAPSSPSFSLATSPPRAETTTMTATETSAPPPSSWDSAASATTNPLSANSSAEHQPQPNNAEPDSCNAGTGDLQVATDSGTDDEEYDDHGPNGGGGVGGAPATVPPGAVCKVCGGKAGKHIHYGSVTCYACRAFFRRSIQNNKSDSYSCKKSGSCSVDSKTKKNCARCRFDKCLAAGMKANWVLSDDERERRFRKSREKKRQMRQQSTDYQGSEKALDLSSSSSPPPARCPRRSTDSPPPPQTSNGPPRSAAANPLDMLPMPKKTGLMLAMPSPLHPGYPGAASDRLQGLLGNRIRRGEEMTMREPELEEDFNDAPYYSTGRSMVPVFPGRQAAAMPAASHYYPHHHHHHHGHHAQHGSHPYFPPAASSGYRQHSVRASSASIAPVRGASSCCSPAMMAYDVGRYQRHPEASPPRTYPEQATSPPTYPPPPPLIGVSSASAAAPRSPPDANTIPQLSESFRAGVAVSSGEGGNDDPMANNGSDLEDEEDNYSTSSGATNGASAEGTSTSTALAPVVPTILVEPVVPMTQDEIMQIQDLAERHDREYRSVAFGEELIKEMVMASVMGIPLSPNATMRAYKLMIQRVSKVAQTFEHFTDMDHTTQGALIKENADLIVSLRGAVFFDDKKKGLDQILYSLGVDDVEMAKAVVVAAMKRNNGDLGRISYRNFNSLQRNLAAETESRYNRLLARVGSTISIHPELVKLVSYVVLFSPDFTGVKNRPRVEAIQDMLVNMVRRFVFAQYPRPMAVTVFGNILASLADLRELTNIKKTRPLASSSSSQQQQQQQQEQPPGATK